jgi:hypothetical protein
MYKKRWLVIVIIVAAAVILAILFDTMLTNHQLAITSLEAPEWVIPSESCQIVCNAKDPDGDELSYNWSASGGSIYGTGACVNWTAPRYNGSYNITVMVSDGLGEEVMKKVTIEVRANNQPKINPLVANAYWTTTSGSLQVTCDATDPDGDELSYHWAASGGDIFGTDTVAKWTAPEETGTYNITIVVKDVHGGEATRWVPLSVNLDPPPIIENLIVTAREPKYLIETPTDYIVLRTKECGIECKVSETSGGVSYTWSCDGGEISGEGPLITWIAPKAAHDSEVIVMVIVSDSGGNVMSKCILFEVVHCPCHFE